MSEAQTYCMFIGACIMYASTEWSSKLLGSFLFLVLATGGTW